MGRFLLTLGVTLTLLGLLWPWISKIGIGRLPGDIIYERQNFRLYFPITTSLLVSLLLSSILWFLRR